MFDRILAVTIKELRQLSRFLAGGDDGDELGGQGAGNLPQRLRQAAGTGKAVENLPRQNGN